MKPFLFPDSAVFGSDLHWILLIGLLSVKVRKQEGGGGARNLRVEIELIIVDIFEVGTRFTASEITTFHRRRLIMDVLLVIHP